jgi:Na+-transporting NADH:ubiquinone oxidoreductase subunit A
MIEGNINRGNLRFISGNVLTGTAISREGYVGFYDSQVTVIPEGNSHEFFGWAMPRLKKFSTSRSYFSWLMPNREFVADTNLNGGQRAEEDMALCEFVCTSKTEVQSILRQGFDLMIKEFG